MRLENDVRVPLKGRGTPTRGHRAVSPNRSTGGRLVTGEETNLTEVLWFSLEDRPARGVEGRRIALDTPLHPERAPASATEGSVQTPLGPLARRR